MATEPKDGEAACLHVVAIIGNITSRHSNPRTLEAGCDHDFLYEKGDGDVTNLQSFTANFKTPEDWLKVKPTIERAAQFHGTLCNIAADVLDAAKQDKSTVISRQLFKACGKLVRIVCPRSGEETNEVKLSDRMGGWCTWP